MAPVTSVLFVSLVLARASVGIPILPRTAPTIIDSVSASTATSTSPSDVLPPPAFTFGPGGLPYMSASPTTATAPLLEMDWLS